MNGRLIYALRCKSRVEICLRRLYTIIKKIIEKRGWVKNDERAVVRNIEKLRDVYVRRVGSKKTGFWEVLK